MPNPHYARGAERERQLVKKLRLEGWEASRTAGSHGAYDVVAMRDGITRLIAVGGGKTPWTGFGRRERAALLIAAERAGDRAFAERAWWPPDRGGCRFLSASEWPLPPNSKLPA